METEVNAEGGGREVRQMFISAVRHSAEWAEQAAGTPIQGASSIIHLLMSSQTTKQPSLPSWDQGKKTAGFLPSCGPVSKAPLSVQWLCILISPVTGWSEKLPWLSKARLVPAWQALMASTEQHVSSLLPMCLQLEQSMGSISVDPMATLSPEMHDPFFSKESILFINVKNGIFVVMGKRDVTARILP